MELPFAAVVPNINLSADSSQPINALLLGSKVPRLIRIPLSLGLTTLRFEFNKIRLSLISVFVELILVAVPVIVNSPWTFTLLNVTLLFVETAWPIDICPPADNITPVPCERADLALAFVKYWLEPSYKSSVSWLDNVLTVPVTLPVTLPLTLPLTSPINFFPVSSWILSPNSMLFPVEVIFLVSVISIFVLSSIWPEVESRVISPELVVNAKFPIPVPVNEILPLDVEVIPPEAASSFNNPDPLVLTLRFCPVVVVNVIVPLWSWRICFPLTYNELGPRYKSRIVLVEDPIS